MPKDVSEKQSFPKEVLIPVAQYFSLQKNGKPVQLWGRFPVSQKIEKEGQMLGFNKTVAKQDAEEKSQLKCSLERVKSVSTRSLKSNHVSEVAALKEREKRCDSKNSVVSIRGRWVCISPFVFGSGTVETRILTMLGKCYATKLHPQPAFSI